MASETVGPLFETASFIEEGLAGEKYPTTAHPGRIVKEWTLQSVSDVEVTSFTQHYNHILE